MPQDEDRGEVTGREAGRKQVDSAIEHEHEEEHPEIGIKGGRRDEEHKDKEERQIIEKTIEVND